MKPEDLVTPREKTRAGFIKMALEKNLMAVPYVEEARALRVLASSVSHPRELLGRPDLGNGLLAASGLSDKALSYLTTEDRQTAIVGMIEEHLEPAGDDFANELVYRYLLTKGDALGGKARNLAGALGDWKFFRTLISVLKLAGLEFSYRDRDSNAWLPQPEDDTGIEKRIRALHWRRNNKDRLLVKNAKLPLIKKGVDLVLLSGNPDDFRPSTRSIFQMYQRYLALGELKGGIDPAGSDEHWKTANFALNRIRGGFSALGLIPALFFIGAAIEPTMASEICSQIDSRVLDTAANLNDENQLATLCNWLIAL